MTFLSVALWVCFPYISCGTHTSQELAQRKDPLSSLLLSYGLLKVRHDRLSAGLVSRRLDNAVMADKSKKKKKRRKKSGSGATDLRETPEIQAPTASTEEIDAGFTPFDSQSAPDVEPAISEDDYDQRYVEDSDDFNDRMANVEEKKGPGGGLSESTRAWAGTGIIDQSSPPGCEPVFELTSLDKLGSLRVGTLEAPPNFYAVVSALRAVDDKQMDMFVQVNRDLLDVRFLRRLVAEKLLANNTDDTENADALEDVLKRVVPRCVNFDKALFLNVGEAEKRMVSLIGSGNIPSAEEVKIAVGDGPLGIFAFWIVVKSAINAWEERAGEPKFATLAPKQLRILGQIESTLEKDSALMEKGGIAPLHKIFESRSLAYQYKEDSLVDTDYQPSMDYQQIKDMFENNRSRAYQYEDKAHGDTNSQTSIDNKKVRKLFDELTTDPVQRLLVLRRLGCLSIQLERHINANYNGFMARSAAYYDVIFRGSVQLQEIIDIKPKPLPYDKGDFFTWDLGIEPEILGPILDSVWGERFPEIAENMPDTSEQVGRGSYSWIKKRRKDLTRVMYEDSEDVNEMK